MEIKNIFFDLDGTLIDSHAGIAYSFNRAYKNVFKKEINIDILPMIGPPLAKMIDLVFTEFTAEKKQQLITEFMPHYDTIGFKKTTLFPGTKKTLNYLHKKYRLFIATNKRYQPTLQILHHLKINSYFQDTVFALDKQQPPYENKAKMVKDILEKFQIKNTESIFIGDTFSDKNAAEQNNISFVHCQYGYEQALPHENKINLISELLEIL